MFGNLGLSHKSSRKNTRSVDAAPASSLAAQAAAITFSKSAQSGETHTTRNKQRNGSVATTKGVEKQPLQRKQPVKPIAPQHQGSGPAPATLAEQQKFLKPAAPMNIQLKKRNSDFALAGSHSSSQGVSSSPSGLFRPSVSSEIQRPRIPSSRSSYYDPSKSGYSPSRNSEKKFLLPNLNTSDPLHNDDSEGSSTAIAAAALAAKKISAASESSNRLSATQPLNNNSKPSLANTGFLQPPSSEISKLIKPPSSPVPSSRSVISTNSDVYYSPAGLNAARQSSFDFFHSTDSFNQPPDTDQSNTFARSRSVASEDRKPFKRHSLHRKRSIKNSPDSRPNKSAASFSDNRSFSVGSSENVFDAKNKVRSISPPLVLKLNDNDTQDSFSIPSPVSNYFSNPNIPNISQVSLARSNEPSSGSCPKPSDISTPNISEPSRKCSQDAFQVPKLPVIKKHPTYGEPSSPYEQFGSQQNSPQFRSPFNQPSTSTPSQHKYTSTADSYTPSLHKKEPPSHLLSDDCYPKYDPLHQTDNISFYSSIGSAESLNDIVNYETSHNFPYRHTSAAESPLPNSENNSVSSEEKELPRYPLAVPGKYKSHPSKTAKHAFKKKGKQVLRDLGFSNDTKNKNQISAAKQLAKGPDTGLASSQKPVEFRKTMRKEKKKHKNFNEDKPWKHHNDSLVVTEAEKKRYEGVWVANRGLYINLIRTPINNPETTSDNETDELSKIPPYAVNVVSSIHAQDLNHPSQLVHGYVVRNLWRRSNLSDEILSKIWNLVDLRKDGTLNRSEFVVGMWLVDQCLYGRKLPKMLDDSVWASVQKLVVQVVIKPKKTKLLK